MSFITSIFNFFGRELPHSPREARNNFRRNCSANNCCLIMQTIISGIMSVSMGALSNNLFDIESQSSETLHSTANWIKISVCSSLTTLNGVIFLASIGRAIHHCKRPSSPIYHRKLIQTSILSTIIAPTSFLGLLVCLLNTMLPRLNNTPLSSSLNTEMNLKRKVTAIACSAMYACHFAIVLVHLGTKEK